MKKVIKSRLFIVIITMIICISGTLYATNKYQASEVVYKASDGTSKNVNDALNELYNNKANNLTGLSFVNFGFASGSSNTVPYGSVGLVFKNCGAKKIYISYKGNLNTYIYASNDPIILGGSWGITFGSTANLKLLGNWGSTYDVSQYEYVAIGWNFNSKQYQSNRGFPVTKNIVTIN